jgi:hypothetical protein
LAASRWSCALSPDRNANPPRPRPRSRQGWAVPHAGREDRLVTSCPCRAQARRRAAQRPCVHSPGAAGAASRPDSTTAGVLGRVGRASSTSSSARVRARGNADHPAVLVGKGHGSTPVEFLLQASPGCLTSGLANSPPARHGAGRNRGAWAMGRSPAAVIAPVSSAWRQRVADRRRGRPRCARAAETPRPAGRLGRRSRGSRIRGCQERLSQQRRRSQYARRPSSTAAVGRFAPVDAKHVSR